MPEAACQDNSEEFFQLKLYESFFTQLCFLMDLNLDTMLLTEANTNRTRLVVIKVRSAIMGVSQSPFNLAICKGDLDLADSVLEFFIKFMSHVNDLIS